MISKLFRRRPFKKLPISSFKLTAEIDVTLPHDVTLPLNVLPHEWSVGDLEEAVGAKYRMMFNAHAALSYELDPTHTESEKDVALLKACHELASIAKWKFPLTIRLIRLLHALKGLSEGISDPMLEPKHRVGGRAAPSMERFRLYCVLASEARCAIKGEEPDEARKSFLRDLEQSKDVKIPSDKWEVLFKTRRDYQGSNEEQRRCDLIYEWSKPRSVERFSRHVLTEHGIWSRFIRNRHSEHGHKIYLYFLSIALLQAKSLVEARG
jgi:hypothetical protein